MSSDAAVDELLDKTPIEVSIANKALLSDSVQKLISVGASRQPVDLEPNKQTTQQSAKYTLCSEDFGMSHGLGNVKQHLQEFLK